MKRLITILALVAGLGFLLAGCQQEDSTKAKGAVASVTADPAVAAELAQARLLVKSCFPAAPLDQARTVHLVFLSSATGKHGPEVVAAREKLFTCLGVPAGKRDAFKNEAITAAEHQTPKILSAHPAAGVREYLTVTLPQLVLKYKGAAASPSPSVKASS